MTIKTQRDDTNTKTYTEDGTKYRMKVHIRFDDSCDNGHETFSITSSVDEKVKNRWLEHSGGCNHDEIAKHFPELAHLIKWHLVSTDGPMHYIANTTYHASQKDTEGPNLGAARRTAIWPEATLEQLRDENALADHLDEIMPLFFADMAALGFKWTDPS